MRAALKRDTFLGGAAVAVSAVSLSLTESVTGLTERSTMSPTPFVPTVEMGFPPPTGSERVEGICWAEALGKVGGNRISLDGPATEGC